MDKRNFLLGYGERLTEKIAAPGKMPGKSHPYSFLEARTRLVPKLEHLVNELEELPAIACPDDQAVGVLRLHPSYLAKSYFPEKLLQSVNLRAVGSRSKKITPEKLGGKKEPHEMITADVFVAGPRQQFREWLIGLPHWTARSSGADDLHKIEDFDPFAPEEKVRPFLSKSLNPVAEVVLHASKEDDMILDGFRAYLMSLDLKIDLDKRFYSRGLCFLALHVPKRLVPEVAKFSFLRVIREMPRLRLFNPVLRSVPGNQPFPVQFPTGAAIDPTLKVAVFDGGSIDSPELTPWVKRYKTKGIGAPVPDFQKHGTMVTSALLFGSLEKGKAGERPYAQVDHYRVLDQNTGKDQDLPDVLDRILDVLQRQKYNFVNLSIGPHLPIEDDDVHMWTSMLDEHFSDGSVLASIAVGNDGELDRESGNARIQVPSDCVNGLAVGACDTLRDDWERAPYSSVGPGRSPGVIKPDLLAFGGTDKEPFWSFDASAGGAARPTCGTSFAAPSALRMALGVRASLGNTLSPLALKALMISRADKASHDRADIGWGRVPRNLEDLIVCRDGTVHVVYQGTLAPAQWLRAPVPVPTKPLAGSVTISATFCFATETDPQDSINYTRSGLEVVFRPHRKERKDPEQTYPDAFGFFKAREYYQTEEELRRDVHKWETTLHATKKLSSERLLDPAFDIHYHARTGGAKARDPRKIPYALIVSVEAPQVPDLYDQVVLRYRTQLEALRPVIEIPIRTKGT